MRHVGVPASQSDPNNKTIAGSAWISFGFRIGVCNLFTVAVVLDLKSPAQDDGAGAGHGCTCVVLLAITCVVLLAVACVVPPHHSVLPRPRRHRMCPHRRAPQVLTLLPRPHRYALVLLHHLPVLLPGHRDNGY
jgi:hypothetical protein